MTQEQKSHVGHRSTIHIAVNCYSKHQFLAPNCLARRVYIRREGVPRNFSEQPCVFVPCPPPILHLEFGLSRDAGNDNTSGVARRMKN